MFRSIAFWLLSAVSLAASTIQSVAPITVTTMPNGPAYVIRIGSGKIQTCPSDYGMYLSLVDPKKQDALPSNFQYILPGNVITEIPGRTYQMACLKVVLN
jgi:hypothetical protein